MTEDYRIKDMIYLRASGMTYEEIGKQFGLSKQRVHQIMNKGRSSKMGKYISQDITFCSNKKCKNKKCKRNHCHIDWLVKPYHSFSDFENTEFCPIQKDKNRFIEVPCNVGDKVYKITRNKVKECEVVFIGISADEKCSYFNFVENYADGTFYKSYSMVFDVIGKTVFLTKEEAEAKLKELKDNA